MICQLLELRLHIDSHIKIRLTEQDTAPMIGQCWQRELTKALYAFSNREMSSQSILWMATLIKVLLCNGLSLEFCPEILQEMLSFGGTQRSKLLL